MRVEIRPKLYVAYLNILLAVLYGTVLIICMQTSMYVCMYVWSSLTVNRAESLCWEIVCSW